MAAAIVDPFEQLDDFVHVNKPLSVATIKRNFKRTYPHSDRDVAATLEQGLIAGHYIRHRGASGDYLWTKAAVENDDDDGAEEEEQQEDGADGGGDVAIPADPYLDWRQRMLDPWFAPNSVDATMSAAALTDEGMRTGNPKILRVLMTGDQGSGKTTAAEGMGKCHVIKHYPKADGSAYSEEELKDLVLVKTLASIHSEKEANKLLERYKAIVFDEADLALKKAKKDKAVFEVILFVMQSLSSKKWKESKLVIFVGYDVTFLNFVRFDVGWLRRIPFPLHVSLKVLPIVVARNVMKEAAEHRLQFAPEITAEVLAADPMFAQAAAEMPYLAEVVWMSLFEAKGEISLDQVIAAVAQALEWKRDSLSRPKK